MNWRKTAPVVRYRSDEGHMTKLQDGKKTWRTRHDSPFAAANGARPEHARRRLGGAAGTLLLLLSACAPDPSSTEDFEEASTGGATSALVAYDCTTRADTGYRSGTPFPVTVVTVNGHPVEIATADAFLTMAKAAEADGILLRINSGFRTMAEQQYLYNCYVSGTCNNGNRAAGPGYSNHQSGHAIDFNTGGGALAWLNAHGAEHGFNRTVPSETWHWEWWGGGSVQAFCQGNPGPASAPIAVETAFQANTGDLWTVGSAGNTDWHLGMKAGTSPSLASLPSGGFEVAFQANTSDLWTVGSAGNTDWHLGMMAGTSPSITALAGGGFEVAFQANTGSLWTVGNAGNTDWHLGMMTGTSPSITALAGGGFEVAFQANTGNLWTVGNAGTSDWRLGMLGGTSPSIAALPTGGFEAAFQANTGDLWTVGNAGNTDWHLGMRGGTSPSIAALPSGGFQVAFQANTSELWTVGSAGNTNWHLGMLAGTSPGGP